MPQEHQSHIQRLKTDGQNIQRSSRTKRRSIHK